MYAGQATHAENRRVATSTLLEKNLSRLCPVIQGIVVQTHFSALVCGHLRLQAIFMATAGGLTRGCSPDALGLQG